MAQVHGIPGEWARVKGTVYGLWPLFLGVFCGGFSLALALLHPVTGGVLFILSLLWSGWCLMRGMRRVERYFKGARGEECVSEILRSLPEGYHVFNDFLAGNRHVDHVVIGPAGVFAIETKFWRGKVTIEEGHVLLDGQLPDRPPLAQVLREAAAVKSQLAKIGWTGVVTPVLTFASNTFEAKIAELGGAVILNANYLRESFQTNRVVIPPAELERVVRLILSC